MNLKQNSINPWCDLTLQKDTRTDQPTRVVELARSRSAVSIGNRTWKGLEPTRWRNHFPNDRSRCHRKF